MYGADVAVADSLRSGQSGLRNAFGPRTSPPSTATILRSALWPIAIMSIIHRSYVLTSNGYITDDWAPVYRAVRNFRAGVDIYNEHFEQVDPHYLYPPGGTLLMAPFGFVPFSNTLPGLALLLYAIGMIQRDGTAILLGHLANIGTLIYFGILIGGGGMAAHGLLKHFTG